ncbi:class I SAM-dependent methyltransferase [Aspergillus stella-maris]|uniref:class I SAM-dependent methyltransferase n=1 Tax=Aspergillus stella-maris TaxID=1810926 RepID=UPI003CCD2325
MALSGDDGLLLNFGFPLTLTGFSAFALCGLLLSRLLARQRPQSSEGPGRLHAFLIFCYCCFIKSHTGGNRSSQQTFLESFYKRQAYVYDTTRSCLLQGRNDMLALVAAQLKAKPKSERIWVDVGGGTGWCIEAMSAYVNVPEFFSAVYLVDLSPSLCEVARQRFRRLGWKNVQVVCEDARTFCPPRRANLVTMSYSLSMLPDYYPVIDSLTSFLAADGVIGVVDFYAQSHLDFGRRNYIGSQTGRHVNWLLRSFWRAWFRLDHIWLDTGRRDYMEFKFGTILTVNSRNRALGWIPYYIWLGRPENKEIDAHNRVQLLCSEDLELAIHNRAANIPLPSSFYQNHSWRAHYDEQLSKHTQFNDEYIYAFTWEDSRQDHSILDLRAEDVVLAMTSAGDNILSYATKSPASIHAVDLNPAQNHLLELKSACYTALPYEDFWMLFGEGKHPDFRHLLLNHLSPHLSSRAFQYWLDRVHIFDRPGTLGLYDTGGSRHALRVIRWISNMLGRRTAMRQLLAADSLSEQVNIWQTLIRPALLSPLLCKLVISQRAFLWKALGVPTNQLAMIESDYKASAGAHCNSRSQAIWRYMVETVDPVAQQTHIGSDNPYYHVSLAGKYSRTCHPEYLSAKAHAMLSQPGALDNLQIHTEEVSEVLTRFAPSTVTVSVLMDSMDWFDHDSESGPEQIVRLNRAMKTGGRVLLRSAALKPWYIAAFTTRGFTAERISARTEGACIDRVNMYASCWICTKVGDVLQAVQS